MRVYRRNHADDPSSLLLFQFTPRMKHEFPTLDALIVGAGCAGLFLLDALSRKGIRALLLESQSIGLGQTTSSQGILHAGLKYSLGAIAGDDAAEAAAAATLWNQMLAGEGTDLRAVRRLADHCYLWRTSGIAGVAGMLGAKMALRTRPQSITVDQRPQWLRGVGGEVLILAETVIDPRSLLQVLAQRNSGRIACGTIASVTHESDCVRVEVDCEQHCTIRARRVILTAGSGNEALAALMGSPTAMQRRPLRQAMIRGPLEMAFGHCIDGAKTRLTITSDQLSTGEVVWHIGGQIAEDGPKMTLADFQHHVLSEARAAIPQLNLAHCAFASYDIDRAEPRTTDGRRPARAFAQTSGAVTTIWPVKLVLAPVIAAQIAATFDSVTSEPIMWPSELPSPTFALRPWELPSKNLWSDIGLAIA